MSSLVKWSGKSFGAWLFIAALCPARGELDILDGKYAGLSTPSPPFAISPALFDVTAQLVATNATQWSYVSCPPKYVGSEQLEGKLVLIRNQKLTCSRKELGVTLIELGAIGSISLGQRSGLLPVMAGKNYYSHAPDETLEPLSLPQTHAVGELVYKLFEDVRVGAIVRARMTPSRNVWLDMWASPYWVLWQAILTIQSAVVLELGVMRLYAYVREDKGPRLSIPQVILFIDSISHMERLAFVAIDPYRSRGIYSDRTVAWMFMNHQSSLARALFIIYFAQAGALSGIATPFIAQPLWAALLLGTCVTSLLVIIVISSFALQHWLLVTAKGKYPRARVAAVASEPTSRPGSSETSIGPVPRVRASAMQVTVPARCIPLLCYSCSRPTSFAPCRLLARFGAFSRNRDVHEADCRARPRRAHILSSEAQADDSASLSAQQGRVRRAHHLLPRCSTTSLWHSSTHRALRARTAAMFCPHR